MGQHRLWSWEDEAVAPEEGPPQHPLRLTCCNPKGGALHSKAKGRLGPAFVHQPLNQPGPLSPRSSPGVHPSPTYCEVCDSAQRQATYLIYVVQEGAGGLVQES